MSEFEHLPVWAQEANARAEAATEGPWEWEAADASMMGLGTIDTVFFEGHVLSCERCQGCQESDKLCMWPKTQDAAFIAHARTDVPRLCRALDRALEALHWYAGDATNDREAMGALREIEEMGA